MEGIHGHGKNKKQKTKKNKKKTPQETKTYRHREYSYIKSQILYPYSGCDPFINLVLQHSLSAWNYISKIYCVKAVMKILQKKKHKLRKCRKNN